MDNTDATTPGSPPQEPGAPHLACPACSGTVFRIREVGTLRFDTASATLLERSSHVIPRFTCVACEWDIAFDGDERMFLKLMDRLVEAAAHAKRPPPRVPHYTGLEERAGMNISGFS